MANIEEKRHTLAHLLAAAVTGLWPDTKRTIGPAIDSGFYYDFDFTAPITREDLTRVEAKMREILPSWTFVVLRTLTTDDARKEYKDNRYKQELIDEIVSRKETLTFYKLGNYEDLCRGGHVENPSKEIAPDSFKLTRLAGAYWRGDEKNKMLTRIYGLAFDTKKELGAYEKLQEEAVKRDHRKLGRELDLFLFSELVGGGLPLWTPRGTLVRDLLDSYVWQLRQKYGYEKVDIPHITKKELYEKSGHWDKFSNELMNIKTREGHEFVMKPMNCPHHIQIYDRKQWSYRELPQRYVSTTKVYRDEQSGELGGLSRVRAITQDDAHVFMRYSQMREEIGKALDIIKTFYGAFDIALSPRLSLHDPAQMEKYLGDSDLWQKMEGELRDLLKEGGWKFTEVTGEAAFYGPKIDFIGTDALNREHQVATIQLDMNQPERFDLSCVNEKGERERIVMIHAAIMGSIERFMVLLLEHTAGNLPLWLAPIQVKVLSLTDAQAGYSQKIHASLMEAGIRSEIDLENESLGKKIRDAKVAKVPYFLVIGKQEMEKNEVMVESRDKGKIGAMSLEKFIEIIKTDKENIS